MRMGVPVGFASSARGTTRRARPLTDGDEYSRQLSTSRVIGSNAEELLQSSWIFRTAHEARGDLIRRGEETNGVGIRPQSASFPWGALNSRGSCGYEDARRTARARDRAAWG